MPPMYDWVCENCKLETITLRSYKDYETPPVAGEDYPQEKQCASEKQEHKWKRLIGGNQSLFRGKNWNGAKGFWSLIGLLWAWM